MGVGVGVGGCAVLHFVLGETSCIFGFEEVVRE